MSETDPPSPRTEPRKIFGEQMDNLKYLLKNMVRDVERLNSPIDALEDHLGGPATIKIGPVPQRNIRCNRYAPASEPDRRGWSGH
jgi:hypothetical protein